MAKYGHATRRGARSSKAMAKKSLVQRRTSEQRQGRGVVRYEHGIVISSKGKDMNNKIIGADWEKTVCKILASQGYWVHFLAPDSRGAQPFDIIAVKDGKAKAIDCKTSVRPIFPISRLEDNQIYAFEKWVRCGNDMPEIWVLYDNNLHIIFYNELKDKQKIDLRE